MRSVRYLAAALVAAGVIAVMLITGASARPRAGAAGFRAAPTGAAFTGTIVLAQSVVRPGQTVRGELVFVNPTSQTRVLVHGCKVDGFFAMGFRGSHGVDTHPAFSLVGCAPPQALVAKPGRTVYRFSTLASYSECTGDTRQLPPKGSPGWSPLCAKDRQGQRNVLPTLPIGHYRVVLVPNGTWLGPHVAAVALTVTG